MTKAYQNLVSQAFIEPIRSVMIVDDDYPTLDEVLSGEVNGEATSKQMEKSWRKKPQEVLSVVNEFRQHHGGPYILDIHDGDMPPPGTDENQAHRLQQTDLLVLDYELNGQVKDRGEKAIAIAKKVLTNNHFNIILVHTRETLADVFNGFLFDLFPPLFKNGESELTSEHDEVADKHFSAVADRIEDAAYLELRQNHKDLAKVMNEKSGPMRPILSYLEGNKVENAFWKPLIREAAAKFERDAEAKGRFIDKKIEVRTWHGQDHLWIRCDQGFIVFKAKGDGVPLLETLHDTLVSWRPFPSRLLLTKLRAIMNERGIEVQDDALGDRAVGAAWYHSLVAATEPERSMRVDQVVRNHSEQLLDQLLPGIATYAEGLASAFGKDAVEAVRQGFDGFDMAKEDCRTRAVTEQNSFAASKPIGGFHLEFGHILEIDGSYWLCLTPACDMLPTVRRNSGIEPDDLEGSKRFTALRLHEKLCPKEIKTAVNNAHRAEYVFANIARADGSTNAAVFALAKEPKAAPASMTMYADGEGRFSDDNFSVLVHHVSTRPIKDKDEKEEERCEFFFADHPARVCGHLRYEYALHIQAMYAERQSRIGLDYVNIKQTIQSPDLAQ